MGTYFVLVSFRWSKHRLCENRRKGGLAFGALPTHWLGPRDAAERSVSAASAKWMTDATVSFLALAVRPISPLLALPVYGLNSRPVYRITLVLNNVGIRV